MYKRQDQSRGDQVIADFIKEDPETLAHVLDVIAGDISTLSRRLIQEAGVEGIYFSTQQVQDERVTDEEYRKIIEPSNIAVLEAANEAGGINILHICGCLLYTSKIKKPPMLTKNIRVFVSRPMEIWSISGSPLMNPLSLWSLVIFMMPIFLIR